jgi:hypothetical protein
MSLLEESKRIAAEFDFTDDDVRKSVTEFIKQMGMWDSLGFGKNMGLIRS